MNDDMSRIISIERRTKENIVADLKAKSYAKDREYTFTKMNNYGSYFSEDYFMRDCGIGQDRFYSIKSNMINEGQIIIADLIDINGTINVFWIKTNRDAYVRFIRDRGEEVCRMVGRADKMAEYSKIALEVLRYDGN